MFYKLAQTHTFKLLPTTLADEVKFVGMLIRAPSTLLMIKNTNFAQLLFLIQFFIIPKKPILFLIFQLQQLIHAGRRLEKEEMTEVMEESVETYYDLGTIPEDEGASV